MMELDMSMSIVWLRSEILTYIAKGKNDSWIARETHHGRDLVCEVRRGLDSPGDLFALKRLLGAPRKVNNDIIPEVGQLTHRYSRLTRTHLEDSLSASNDFPTVHRSTVDKNRRDLHFIFTPPITIRFP
jgi:hypothetical protein